MNALLGPAGNALIFFGGCFLVAIGFLLLFSVNVRLEEGAIGTSGRGRRTLSVEGKFLPGKLYSALLIACALGLILFVLVAQAVADIDVCLDDAKAVLRGSAQRSYATRSQLHVLSNLERFVRLCVAVQLCMWKPASSFIVDEESAVRRTEYQSSLRSRAARGRRRFRRRHATGTRSEVGVGVGEDERGVIQERGQDQRQEREENAHALRVGRNSTSWPCCGSFVGSISLNWSGFFSVFAVALGARSGYFFCKYLQRMIGDQHCSIYSEASYTSVSFLTMDAVYFIVSLIRIRVAQKGNAAMVQSYGFAAQLWSTLSGRASVSEVVFFASVFSLIAVSVAHLGVALAIGLQTVRQTVYGALGAIAMHLMNNIAMDAALPTTIVDANLPSTSSPRARWARLVSAGIALLLPHALSIYLVLRFLPLALSRRFVLNPHLALDIIYMAACSFALAFKVRTPRSGYVRFDSIV